MTPCTPSSEHQEPGPQRATTPGLPAKSFREAHSFQHLAECDFNKHIAEMFVSGCHFRLQVAKTDPAPIYRSCIWLCSRRLLLLRFLASSQLSFSLKGSDFGIRKSERISDHIKGSLPQPPTSLSPPLVLCAAGEHRHALTPRCAPRLFLILMTMLMETDQPHYGSKYKRNSPAVLGLRKHSIIWV